MVEVSFLSVFLLLEEPELNTSILTVVMTSALLAGQNGSPAWQNDYSKAQKQSAAQQTPLAVVFGSGANGWSKVVREASPGADVTKLLAEKYICVYIDTATPAGKKRAQEFGIDGATGVVLSDRAGLLQAFWHQGDMSSQNMARYLVKYADPRVVVNGTETANTTRTSFYPANNNSEINLQGSTPFDSYCPSCNGGGRSRR